MNFIHQDGGEIDQESERAVCKALVVSIVEKVTKAPAKAATDEQFMALCRDVGMQMGLTKVFFQQKAFNSIERLRYGEASFACDEKKNQKSCLMFLFFAFFDKRA